MSEGFSPGTACVGTPKANLPNGYASMELERPFTNLWEVERESTHIVSRERSSLFEIPMIPTDLAEDENEEVNAPPKFFLATPAQICAENSLRPLRIQSERLVQFERLAQIKGLERMEMTEEMAVDDPESQSRFSNFAGRGARVGRFRPANVSERTYQLRDAAIDDTDDVCDQEVAGFLERSHVPPPTKCSKFKLRPKPLNRHDLWDSDLVFRS